MDHLAGVPAIVSVIALPLIAACLAIPPRPRLAAAAAGASVLGVPMLAGLLAWQVRSAGPVLHEVGAWGAPLGISLVADGLSALLVLATALVMAITSLYALSFPGGFHGSADDNAHFWPVWLLLWAGLNALFLSGDLFNLYVGLEVLSLAAVILAALSGTAAALVAAMRYLLAALLGSLAYLLGVALLYGATGVLDLALLAERAVASKAAMLGAGLITAGLLFKTALVPLHIWLPRAHANAAAPVSAVLSGLVVKASFYLLLRLWLGPFAVIAGEAPLYLLGVLGGIAVLWGGIQAVLQQRLKLVVAYSTVAQIGYLFLVFPLAAAGAAQAAWQGALLHLLVHATAKAAAFLAAGNLMLALGHDRLHGIRGLGTRLRMSLLAFALAGASLMGLPPSGGFLAKWLLLEAAFATGQWWWAVVLLAGSALAAIYVFRILRLMMEQADPDAPALQAVAPALERTALALALSALALGFAAPWPLALLGPPPPGFTP